MFARIISRILWSILGAGALIAAFTIFGDEWGIIEAITSGFWAAANFVGSFFVALYNSIIS